MDLNKFWNLMTQTRAESNNNPKRQAELLSSTLVTGSVEEILEFDRIFDSLDVAADLRDLCDVADFIYGGLGDSGWKDFRAWLIGQGKEIYEMVVTEPESLVEIVEPNERYKIVAEEISYVALTAYYAKTGVEIPPPQPLYPFEYRSNVESIWKSITSASEYEDVFRKRYPKVWEKFSQIDSEDY